MKHCGAYFVVVRFPQLFLRVHVLGFFVVHDPLCPFCVILSREAFVGILARRFGKDILVEHFCDKTLDFQTLLWSIVVRDMFARHYSGTLLSICLTTVDGCSVRRS